MDEALQATVGVLECGTRHRSLAGFASLARHGLRWATAERQSPLSLRLLSLTKALLEVAPRPLRGLCGISLAGMAPRPLATVRVPHLRNVAPRPLGGVRFLSHQATAAVLEVEQGTADAACVRFSLASWRLESGRGPTGTPDAAGRLQRQGAVAGRLQRQRRGRREQGTAGSDSNGSSASSTCPRFAFSLTKACRQWHLVHFAIERERGACRLAQVDEANGFAERGARETRTAEQAPRQGYRSPPSRWRLTWRDPAHSVSAYGAWCAVAGNVA